MAFCKRIRRRRAFNRRTKFTSTQTTNGSVAKSIITFELIVDQADMTMQRPMRNMMRDGIAIGRISDFMQK